MTTGVPKSRPLQAKLRVKFFSLSLLLYPQCLQVDVVMVVPINVAVAVVYLAVAVISIVSNAAPV